MDTDKRVDATTAAQLDAIAEDEITRGFRIKAVPDELKRDMKAEGVVPMDYVRFTRLNPKRRRKIAEIVQQQYHRDLRNPDILSTEQLLKIALERGEWSPEKTAKLAEHQENIQQLMGELYVDGVADNTWYDDLVDNVRLYRESVTQQPEVPQEVRDVTLAKLQRWLDYDIADRPAYTELYAKEQGVELYSPDRDFDQLIEGSPNEAAAEALSLVDELKFKTKKFLKLRREQVASQVLFAAHTRIFSDSCEARRDNYDSLARVYFCVERADKFGNPDGPLAPSFEELWDFPDSMITWGLEEQFFFLQGIPEEVRALYDAFGFRKTDRAQKAAVTTDSGESAVSVASPDPLSSKGDTSPVTETAVFSSELQEATT